MKKVLKKVFKILLIIILVILIVLISTPIIFKKKIEETVKTEINKAVKAKVDFESFGLNLITGFPNLTISLRGLSVVGVDEFEGDTLVSFKAFKVKANPIAYLQDGGIDVKAIILDRPLLNGIILEDGTANWDIAIDTSTVEEVEEIDTTTTESGEIKVKLKTFEIRNANIVYDDRASNMYAAINDLNFKLSGDLSTKFSSLDILLTMKAINFKMDGIPYAKNMSFSFYADVDADLENSIYTLKENEIKLNDLTLGLKGLVEMPTEDINMDIQFETKKTEFKSLLSMVPSIYMSDFSDLKTSGKLALSGYAKGALTEETLPNVGIKLLVEDAMFSYPDLPKSVTNINIDLEVFNDGVDDNNSAVDLNKFHLEIAENPIDFVFHVKAYAVDPMIFGNIKMNFNLGSLADAIPMENMELSGIITSDVNISGVLSTIEQEKYEDFDATGNITIKDLKYNSPDLPAALNIVKTDFNFSPRYLDLSTLDIKIGKSDVHLDGKIENYLAYVFKDEVIKGKFNFSSNLLDANEFMTESEEEAVVEEEPIDSSEMEVVEVPKNIDFQLVSMLKLIKYDNMEITNIDGLIIVKDGIVSMDKLGMNLLEGSMVVTGKYDASDIENPFVDFGLDIKNFDIPSTYNTFNTVQKLAPIGKNCEGNVSIMMTFNSKLQQNMEPDMNSIKGAGRLQSKTIGIKNSNMFNKIADALKNDKYREVTMKDVDMQFTIDSGRIFIEPFETNIAGKKATISGDQGLDQTMNYLINVDIPKSELGGAGALLDNLTGSSLAKGLNVGQSDNVNVNLDVTGTCSDPKVGVRLGSNKEAPQQQVKEQVKQKITQEVKQKTEAAKQTVKKNTKAQADKIIADAEKKAAQIRKEGKSAADKVRQEGDVEAKKITDGAKGKNPVAVKAAEKSAQVTRNQANQKADKIESESDAKAQKVIDDAKAQAAKLE